MRHWIVRRAGRPTANSWPLFCLEPHLRTRNGSLTTSHVVFTYSGKGKNRRQRVWLVDTQTKVYKHLIAHPTQLISTLGLTRDNRRLFYTATDHQSDVFLLSLDK